MYFFLKSQGRMQWNCYIGTPRWWMETILRDHCVNHRQTIDQGGVKEFGIFP